MVTVVDCKLVNWSNAMDRFFYLRSLNSPSRSKWLACAISGLIASAPACAHQPVGSNIKVHPRIGTNLIPPLGNHVPSHRERFNRPTYVGGMIASWISPTSQEAMSWSRSVNQRLYANHAPWTENRYFYPKPWEVLAVGPRVPVEAEGPNNAASRNTLESEGNPTGETTPLNVNRDEDGTIKLAPTIEVLPPPSQ
jgi:hypothetical protein